MRRAVVALLSLVTVGASTVLLSAPATAAAPPILLSTDGVTFTRSIVEPLFAAEFRIVPGDSLTRDLWVRNAGSSPAHVRVDLLDATSSNLLFARALSVGMSAARGDGTSTSTTVAAARRCTVLLSGLDLQPGQTKRLDAQVALANLNGTRGQQASASFGFRVVLWDASVAAPKDATSCVLKGGQDWVDVPGTGGSDDDGDGPPPAPSTPPTKPGDLAYTGAEVGRALGAAALALLGGGLLVIAAGRRRRREDETS